MKKQSGGYDSVIVRRISEDRILHCFRMTRTDFRVTFKNLMIIYLQVAIQPLRDGTDLRDNVQVALAMFKENCGLAPISNIKQCIRMLVSRIAGSSEEASLQLIMRAEVSLIRYLM